MIKLYDSQISDILPEQLAYRPEVRALSYAIMKAMRRLIDYAEATSVYSMIDRASHKVLDMLAVELDTQYYSDTLDIEAKRRLIKGTLVWYMSAGTPSAVEELVAAVFGKGEVREWFEYGDDPYFFEILTNARLTEDIVERFLSIIERVKNTRSHIRRILIERDVTANPRIGSGTESVPDITISNNAPDRENDTGQKEYAAAGAYSVPLIIVTNSKKSLPDIYAALGEGAASGAINTPNIIILNGASFQDTNVELKEGAAAGAESEPEITLSNNKKERQRDVSIAQGAGSGATGSPVIVLTNNRAADKQDITFSEKAAGGAGATPEINAIHSGKVKSKKATAKTYAKAGAEVLPEITVPSSAKRKEAGVTLPAKIKAGTHTSPEITI